MALDRNRREFLGRLSAAVLGGASVLTFLEGCTAGRLATYRTQPVGSAITIVPAEYPELAMDGGAIALEVQGRRELIVVVRMEGEKYLALSPVCSHLGCIVQKEADFFRCPCHGSTYTVSGAVVRGPAEAPLARYQTQFSQNELTIKL